VAHSRALRSHQVGSLRHHRDELEQLHHGQAGLPPNREGLARFWYLCVHANEVIRVHDSVDETVEENGQVNVTIVINVRVEPVKEEDGDVMVNMQKRKLTPLFANNNKECIPKVPDLRDIEEPQEIGHRGIFVVVSNAGIDSVVASVSHHAGFNCHVGAQEDLRYIVDKLDRIRVHGRDAQLHDLGTNHHEQKVGQSNAKGRGKVCQKPSL
jgi:hypothetical protein